MSSIDLSSMKTPELRDLLVRVNGELTKREGQDKENARAQIIAIADSLGMSVAELIGKQKADKPITKVAARYRNPADHSKLWTGRGRQPRWVAAALAAGQSLQSLEIPSA